MASRLLGAVFAVALWAHPQQAASQIPPVDEAVFVVRANGQVVGREEIALRQVTDATGQPGWTLSVINQYPHTASVRTFARFGSRRVTIRIATIGGETAREYPNRANNVLADEWVLGLYAVAAATEPGPVSILYPRAGTRAAGTLEDRGMERTTLGTVGRTLRHVVLTLPDDTHHLWFDGQGRLMKVTIPSRNLVAERQLR